MTSRLPRNFVRSTWVHSIALIPLVVLAGIILSSLSLSQVQAGGNCGTYKTFNTNDVLTASDLNNSLTQAAVTNSTTDCLGGYSATVSQMGSTADPFPGGSASLATSLTGELQRIRYQLANITGQTNWYNRASPLNPPGDIALGVSGTSSKDLYFHHSSTFYTAFRAQPTASVIYGLPFAPPPSVGSFLTSTSSSGTPAVASMSWIGVRSYLAGLTLSNDGSSPNTVIDIAAGMATASDQTFGLNVPSAVTKSTAAWVVGTGNGCLDTGSVASNTWYHVYVIARTDTNVIDELCSTSATSPIMPTNYGKLRRIGSFKTATASTNILAFTQDGDRFQWAASILDVNLNPQSTSAVSRTLTVPTGVNVVAIINVVLNPGTTGNGLTVHLSDLSVNDEAPSLSAAPLAEIGATGVTLEAAVGPMFIRTNTSAQIRSRMSAAGVSDNLLIATLGWIDSRGRNN